MSSRRKVPSSDEQSAATMGKTPLPAPPGVILAFAGPPEGLPKSLDPGGIRKVDALRSCIEDMKGKGPGISRAVAVSSFAPGSEISEEPFDVAAASHQAIERLIGDEILQRPRRPLVRRISGRIGADQGRAHRDDQSWPAVQPPVEICRIQGPQDAHGPARGVEYLQLLREQDLEPISGLLGQRFGLREPGSLVHPEAPGADEQARRMP